MLSLSQQILALARMFLICLGNFTPATSLCIVSRLPCPVLQWFIGLELGQLSGLAAVLRFQVTDIDDDDDDEGRCL
jgi:hypothetical protein